MLRNFACALILLAPLTVRADFISLNVTETLDFVTGRAIDNQLIHPSNYPDSSLDLGDSAASSAGLYCTDYAQAGVLQQQFLSFNYQTGSAPTIVFQGETANLGEDGGLLSFYSYVADRYTDGFPKTGGLFTEFMIERDISGNLYCPLGFECVATESYEASFASTRSGREWEATRVVKAELSYNGRCYRIEGDLENPTRVYFDCPIQTSCTEQWSQIGEISASALPPPTLLDQLKETVRAILRDDSTGDVRVKSTTIGVRG